MEDSRKVLFWRGYTIGRDVNLAFLKRHVMEYLVSYEDNILDSIEVFSSFTSQIELFDTGWAGSW